MIEGDQADGIETVTAARSTDLRSVRSEEPAHVVVLCHANVARSVAAAFLLADATDERGVTLSLRTAGTHATEGQPVSQRTVAAIAKVTGAPASLGAHRAHQLTEADVEWADLIIAMELSQVHFVRRVHPSGAAKTGTLATLADELPQGSGRVAERVAALDLAAREGTPAGDVEDPAGGGDEAYERAMSVLVTRCGDLARRLKG